MKTVCEQSKTKHSVLKHSKIELSSKDMPRNYSFVWKLNFQFKIGIICNRNSGYVT